MNTPLEYDAYLCYNMRTVVIFLMLMNLLEQFNQKKIAEIMDGKKAIPDFRPGDTLSVHVILNESGRTRVQKFEGVCIARRNRGLHSSYVVRRVVGSYSVKRCFPLYSPSVQSIEVVRRGIVRRAKLYYLEGLSGRASRIKERRLHPPKSAAQTSTQPIA